MVHDSEMTPSSSARSKGLVGGVKNSSSPEMSPVGPMASGHLQSHFQTAILTRFTSNGDMVREGSSKNKKRMCPSRLEGSVPVKPSWRL